MIWCVNQDFVLVRVIGCSLKAFRFNILSILISENQMKFTVTGLPTKQLDKIIKSKTLKCGNLSNKNLK